jgi:hypothetical protein
VLTLQQVQQLEVRLVLARQMPGLQQMWQLNR